MAATTEDRAYSGLPNKAVSAADGIDYAYRDTGGEAVGVFGRDVGVLCGMPDEERW